MGKNIKKHWRLYAAMILVGALWIIVWTSSWSAIFRICESSVETDREVCRALGPGDTAVWLTLVIALALAAPYVQTYIKKLSIPGVGEVETQDRLPPGEDVAQENNAIDDKVEEYRRWLKSTAPQRREDKS